MATNPPSGDGHRNGAVRNRSQVYNPKTEQWVKRDKDTGRFMDVKQDGTPFKGVPSNKVVHRLKVCEKKSELKRGQEYNLPSFMLTSVLSLIQ